MLLQSLIFILFCAVHGCMHSVHVCLSASKILLHCKSHRGWDSSSEDSKLLLQIILLTRMSSPPDASFSSAVSLADFATRCSASDSSESDPAKNL